MSAIHILLNIGSIHIFLQMFSVRNYKRGSLTDPKLPYQIGILFRVDNLQILSRQHFLSHLTVGAGTCGKQIFMGFYRLYLHLVLRHRHHGGMHLLQSGMSDVIKRTVLVFLGFSVIPVLHRTVISGNTAVDLSLLSAFRAGKMFSAEITVLAADRIGRRNGIIRQFIIFCNFY